MSFLYVLGAALLFVGLVSSAPIWGPRILPSRVRQKIDPLGEYAVQRTEALLEPTHWPKVVSGEIPRVVDLYYTSFCLEVCGLKFWWSYLGGSASYTYVSFPQAASFTQSELPFFLAKRFQAAVREAWPELVPRPGVPRPKQSATDVVAQAEQARKELGCP